MKKFFLLLLVLCSILCMTGVAMATPTVDGSFDPLEWAGHFADDDGVGPGGFVDPGWGGQAFDVEYLGLYFDSDTVFFGLQTGFDVRTSTGGFGPGDFGINVDSDSYYEYAIDFSFSGNNVTYALVDMGPGAATWEDVAYPVLHIVAQPYEANYDPDDDVLAEFTINNAFGSGDFGNGGTSYVLEGSFDLDLLDAYTLGNDMTLHWTMECGNDYLNRTSHPVPEPGTMFLIGSGLIGLGLVGRKKFL